MRVDLLTGGTLKEEEEMTNWHRNCRRRFRGENKICANHSAYKTKSEYHLHKRYCGGEGHLPVNLRISRDIQNKRPTTGTFLHRQGPSLKTTKYSLEDRAWTPPYIL